MSGNPFFTSLTRMTPLGGRALSLQVVDRADWRRGDFVAARVEGGIRQPYRVELTDGRMAAVVGGDTIVGALGERFATLEATGDWRDVGEDGRMHLLTSAGLFGKCDSKSAFLEPLIEAEYVGHSLIDGAVARMSDFTVGLPDTPYDIPTILLIGSSMSAGKTTTARVVIRLLSRMGYRVAGTKLTGAGRYRDTLAMKDAGAAVLVDFVEAGVPSTIGDPKEVRKAIRMQLAKIALAGADVTVAEAGASPLEPYNGEVAIDELGDSVACVILCASDPYSVLGVCNAWGREPDLVTGPAANTKAGVALVAKLSGLPAVNVIDRDCAAEVKRRVVECLSRFHRLKDARR